MKRLLWLIPVLFLMGCDELVVTALYNGGPIGSVYYFWPVDPNQKRWCNMAAQELNEQLKPDSLLKFECRLVKK